MEDSLRSSLLPDMDPQELKTNTQSSACAHVYSTVIYIHHNVETTQVSNHRGENILERSR
jgi:hypothetical protein